MLWDRCNAPHQAEASGPLGGLDMRGLGRPTHGPCCGEARGPVPLEARDNVRQPPVGLVQLQPHRVTQGEGVIEGLTSGAHASPPGHGSARARKAPCSTLAAMRVVSSSRCRTSAPISASEAPRWSRGVAREWRRRWAPVCTGWSPARASARHTIVPTACPLAKPRRGARIRTQTCRVAPGQQAQHRGIAWPVWCRPVTALPQAFDVVGFHTRGEG